MASKNFSGTLDLPLGSKAARMKWRFTHQKTTGDVIAASPETTELTETGQYNFDLKFGQILIESKLPSQQNWFSHGSVVIDENTAISTLPELLIATNPVTEGVILQMQAILQDARDAEASSLESSIEAQDLLNETQGLINSFQSVEQIKKKATLSLDFTKNEHKTYEALGLESKPLAGILTTERATAGTYQSPFGLRTAEPNVPRVAYDEVDGSPLGLLCEANATNLFLNSEAPIDQSINTVAGNYTLSFLGGGEINLSGAASGSLVGGTARSSLTVTSSGGIVNLSISGDVNFVQFESGANATSYIKTESSVVTRGADDSRLNNYVDNWIQGTVYLSHIHAIPPSSLRCQHYYLTGKGDVTRAGVGLATEAVGLVLRRRVGNSDFQFSSDLLIPIADMQVGETYKTAFIFKKSESGVRFSVFVNGERKLEVENALDFTAAIRDIFIGRVTLADSALGVNLVREFSAFPVKITDEEAMELTR